MVHQRAGELAGIPDAPDHESLRGAFAPPALNQSSRTVSAGAAGDSVAAVWTTNYASGLTSFDDYGVAIAIDASRNIYVTGSSHNDYSTIKYDSSGAEKWVARYDGPGNSYDQATTIAVDASGNVYVTGESYVAGSTYDDYATVKYNSSGTQQWVARYDGPERDDKATAIAVDASGNVYVTGESDGSGTYYDYATVKYNSSGAEQWVARYDGPGNSEDYATGIAVDSSGNVYVTGASYSSNTFFDYATVKYDTLGAEQWAARYDGPGYTDFAYAIALDASGNVMSLEVVRVQAAQMKIMQH
jgi:hypothetical protein